MNIDIYDILFDKLVEHNAKNSDINYGNKIVPFAPTERVYPFTVFTEVRNVAVKSIRNPLQSLSSLGYRVNIFAQTKGEVTKLTIARNIAKQVDSFLSRVGLFQTSFNVFEQENDNTVCQIVLMYEGTLHDNRAKFI